jgi:hypothetical protein
MKDLVKLKGYIQAKIKYKDTGKIETIQFKNTILDSGKMYLAKCLLEEFPKLSIKYMIFGDGGTNNGQPREISPMQESLFGVTRIKKTVVSQVDPDMPKQIIFSVVIGEEEGNGFSLNEMALVLSDDTLFNLSTFSDLNKTDQMEIAWSWFVCFA